MHLQSDKEVIEKIGEIFAEKNIMMENLWQELAAVRNLLYHNKEYEEVVDNITKCLETNNPSKNKLD